MSFTMNVLRALACAALLGSPAVWAAGAELKLDRAPVSMDARALQHGAKLFVNYCLNCHGASALRYNRLTNIGLTETQIRDNLVFGEDKVGDLMKVAMNRDEAKAWFGAAPPDLSVIARARASEFGSGADWLYTYLRSFYRDPNRPTGWNNAVFENVGMPHVLWELQGEQTAHFAEQSDGHGNTSRHLEKLALTKPGTMSAADYDKAVADLVSFIVWMGEPSQELRKQIGMGVIGVLIVLAALTYLLKRAYWKDIH